MILLEVKMLLKLQLQTVRGVYGGEGGEEGPGAGVRERGVKTAGRIGGRRGGRTGRQGGWEAQQGDGEVLYRKGELLALGPQGLQEATTPHRAASRPPCDPGRRLGLTCWWPLCATSSSMLSVNSVLASSVSSAAAAPGSKSRRER